MKQLQHTSKIPEILETYICNIGEGKAGPVDSGRWGRRQWLATARENHCHASATSTRLGLAAMVGDVGARSAMAAKVGGARSPG
jgi:hypothetical protein